MQRMTVDAQIFKHHAGKAGEVDAFSTDRLVASLRADAFDLPQQLLIGPPDRTVLNEGVNLAVHPVQFGLDDADQVIMADPHRLVVSPLQPDFSALSMPTRPNTTARMASRMMASAGTFGTPLRRSQNSGGAQRTAMNAARKKGTRSELAAFIPATMMMKLARINGAGNLVVRFGLSSTRPRYHPVSGRAIREAIGPAASR